MSQRTKCKGATHLQNPVFREVCAVDSVPYFVFAVQGAQRVGPKMPCDFLLKENISIVEFN